MEDLTSATRNMYAAYMDYACNPHNITKLERASETVLAALETMQKYVVPHTRSVCERSNFAESTNFFREEMEDASTNIHQYSQQLLTNIKAIKHDLDEDIEIYKIFELIEHEKNINGILTCYIQELTDNIQKQRTLVQEGLLRDELIELVEDTIERNTTYNVAIDGDITFISPKCFL